MDPSYETVVDPASIVWTLSAMGIHGAMLALQVGLILQLIASGALALFLPRLDAPWLRRLGAVTGGSSRARGFGAARIALGLGLAAPLVVAAPAGVSLVAGFAALALLLALERGLPSAAVRPGRFARRTAIAAAALVTAFSVWEAEDALALGVELFATAQHWRVHELSGNPARLDVKEPVTLDQRRKVAASCQANLFDGVVPLYVDAMNDRVSRMYAAKPTRIYLIGADGRVLYNPGIGPFGFNPDRLESEIAKHLAAAG
jgi:hypothetical protein